MSGKEYVSIQEAAKRIGCSVRHVHRLLAVNDNKKIGVVHVGRRMVRICWTTFEQALTAGALKS